jgi:hypothetical protein
MDAGYCKRSGCETPTRRSFGQKSDWIEEIWMRKEKKEV